MKSPPLELGEQDWERLARMRAGFLGASETPAPLPDYWRDRRDLELYDATFGERIRWKWIAVLDEIARRGIQVPQGRVVDFGAGTGIATRAFAARHGVDERTFAFVERSPEASAFARAATLGEAPGARILEEADTTPDVLLASHVLDELDAAGRARLLALARSARLVIWVESGAKATSRALAAVRDELLDVHDPLLPCTHRERCGVLASGHETDWCHHFAPPAPEAFTTAFWRTFSHTLRIDLRALPFSWLVLASRQAPPPHEPHLVRVLGTPRIEKGRARLLACSESGVEEIAVLQRVDRAWFRALEKGTAERRLALERSEGRVTRLEPR